MLFNRTALLLKTVHTTWVSDVVGPWYWAPTGGQKLAFSFFLLLVSGQSNEIRNQNVKIWALVSVPVDALYPTLMDACHLTNAEKEPGGELRRGQRGGDPGEQALHGRPGWHGPVHPQGLPHRHAHPQLVPLHPAQSGAEGGRGVMERLPLHSHQVSVQPPQPQQWDHVEHFALPKFPAFSF